MTGELIPKLKDNISHIKQLCGNTSDLLVNEFVTGGIHCALLCCEGMVSTSVITELIFEPITDIDAKKDSEELSILAERFALGRGGRSPRCAKQFIESLGGYDI